MIIAVMSDSHDNIWNLRKALAIIKEKRAGMIIHCGDFVLLIPIPQRYKG